MRKLTLIFVSIFSILLFSCEKPQNIDIKGRPFNFKLLSKDKQVSLKDYEKRYKVILIYFGYTHCPDVCPTVLHRLSSMYDMLGSDRKYVKVLFITLDPKRDTPSIANEYAKFFNKNFSGLSGNPNYIKKVADNYGVVYKIVPSKTEGYLIDHTDNIYVIYNKSLKTIFFDKDQNPAYMASYIKKLLTSKN
ncbi:SCO family protein [Hydrogenobaculum acidophilum]